MLSNGDSPAGPEMISPEMFREFAKPYETKMAATASELGLSYVLHICGDTALILEDMVETGADGLELDYKTDALLARDITRNRCSFIGNIDPSGVLALGDQQTVAMKTRELLDIFGKIPGFILNAGCAIPAETPPENIRTMISIAREFL
jgi:uroporphyrinogen-III decarboxylase